METIKALERILEPGWLEKLRSSQGALTERELVERALKFTTQPSAKSYFSFISQLHLAHQDDEHDPPPSDGMKATCDRFRDAVKAITDGAVTSERAQTWRRIADGIVPIERTTGSGEFHYLEVVNFAGPEPAGLFALILLWLHDPKRPFARELRQCQKCKGFFLVRQPQTGRPRRYCSQKHMQEAHDAGAAGRVKTARKVLSEDMAEAVRLYRRGKRVGEIARTLQRPEKIIRSAIERSRKSK